MTVDLTQVSPDAAPTVVRLNSPVRVGVFLLWVNVVTGVAIGLLWAAWAQSAPAVLYKPDGQSKTFIIPFESEAQIASDGRFAVLSAAAGVLIALLAWQFKLAREWKTPIVLAVGGIGSALIASLVGRLLVPGSHHNVVNTQITPSLQLHGVAWLSVQALIAVLLFTVIAGLSNDKDFIAPVLVEAETASGDATAAAEAGGADGDGA
jgi:hypothetical protein